MPRPFVRISNPAPMRPNESILHIHIWQKTKTQKVYVEISIDFRGCATAHKESLYHPMAATLRQTGISMLCSRNLRPDQAQLFGP